MAETQLKVTASGAAITTNDINTAGNRTGDLCDLAVTVIAVSAQSSPSRSVGQVEGDQPTARIHFRMAVLVIWLLTAVTAADTPAIVLASTLAYVSNAADGTMSVIDTDVNTVVGAFIPVGRGPFGVAVASPTPTCSTLAPGAVFCDGFDDNTIDSSYWTRRIIGTGDVDIQETNGRLETTLGPNVTVGGDGNVAAFYDHRCQFLGDFDMEIGFELLQWPAATNVRVGIVLNPPDLSDDVVSGPGGVRVARAAFANDEYFISYDPGVNGAGASIPTSDSTGKLRMVRRNDIVTGYYWSTNGWIQLDSGTHATSDRFKARVGIRVPAGEFSRQLTSAALDNFIVNQGTLVCPPSPTPTRTPTPTPTPTKIKLRYYALGDSVAAGHGLGSGDGQIYGTCRISPDAYPAIVAEQLQQLRDFEWAGFTHLACSGATTMESPFAAGNWCNGFTPFNATDLPGQVDMVLRDRPFSQGVVVLVSITAGANDFDFPTETLSGTYLCRPQAQFDAWVRILASRAGQNIVKEGVRLLNSIPNARVVMTDYHNPFNPNSDWFNLLASKGVVQFLDTRMKVLHDFGGVPWNQSCADFAPRDLRHRATIAVLSLNREIRAATGVLQGNFPGRVAMVGQNRTLGELALFSGHESPKGHCGSDPPDEKDTFVQFPKTFSIRGFFGALVIHTPSVLDAIAMCPTLNGILAPRQNLWVG